MQISRVRISNILGIEELEFSPEGFTQISGRNGVGKTSVLEAMKAALRGGHDATLLRKGAKKGEVVIVLDDGTEVRRRVNESTSTTDVVQNGKKVNRPIDTLKQLTDALSINPVQFLTADAKDRVRVLLESLPLEADIEKLSSISGLEVQPRPGVHALVVIDDVRTKVYDDRTGTNRAVTEKRGTIAQLRQALPPESTGVQGDETELQAKLDEIDAAREAEGRRISEKLAGLRKTKDEAVAAKREQITQLQQEINDLNAAFIETESKANTQQQKAATKHMADSSPIKLELQRIRDDREGYARRQQTLDTIATMDTELEGLEAEAENQTAALDAIDAYKLELLNSLPIPGLEVRAGELFCDGVPFDRLNTARQVEIAVEIAKVRAGELGVICVDRIECLDEGTLAEFRDRAADSGLQLFVTRVSNDDFTIE